MKYIGIIYTVVVAYMAMNFVAMWINHVVCKKRNELSIMGALEELIQEHLKMTPGYTKGYELLTDIRAAFIGYFFTIPILIKMGIQHYRNVNVRY